MRKSFGKFVALDGLDLTVDAGTVAGFLGPNGAGKSTTIRVLLGLYGPDGGSVSVLGRDPFTDAVALHERIAYVPGDVSLWPGLTGGEAIDLLVSLRGVHASPARRSELIERFEFDPTKKTDTYSKGNRQKVALIAALAAEADLYILDEPTSGLDPLMEAVFREYIRAAAARGASVLLSSHILSEVEELCDAVTIIRAGKTVQTGTLTQLRHLTRSTVTVHVEGDTRSLAALDGVHDFRRDDDTVVFHVDDTALADVTRALSALRPRGLTIEPPSLEELFLRQYGDRIPS
nr:ABC transporter ATP-binding protein [Rhodococcus sp. HNM0569]